MNIIEWLAVLATIISVIMLAIKNKLGWIFSIAGCILYSIVFFQQKLYANTLLQLVFIGQSIYGILLWNKKTNSEFKKMDIIPFFATIALTVGVSMIISVLLSIVTDVENSMIDMFLSVSSIVALVLMAKKFIQSWFVWMAIDVGYIYLFIETGLWLSACLYFLLLLICIFGYIKWRKNI